MNYHFIAIGGSAMHNLAIALHKKGETITGSDDELFEPSRSRLASYGLLPLQVGWFPEKIHAGLDAIVLGMHAKADNPELLKAQESGMTIYSYPEFLYNQTRNKTRVVIGGSHGKTTTTAMVMHVLKEQKTNFDYMVGAKVHGFETMVDFSESSEIAVFEGDEYLTSPIDPRPKFHLYRPNIALLTGIAWDHINVFPTFEQYVEAFRVFIGLIEKGGTLVYYNGDETILELVKTGRSDINYIPYSTHPHRIEQGETYLIQGTNNIKIKVFGNHNLQNISGAHKVCQILNIPDSHFYQAISTFTGADRRLELILENNGSYVFRDFAHSPSKLRATIEAVRQQFPEKRIIACMELHTYSSLSEDFLIQYAGTMNPADEAIVFFSHHAIELKRLKPISQKQVYDAFQKDRLTVLDGKKIFIEQLKSFDNQNTVYLFLSSGDFSGINFMEFSKELLLV